MYFFPKDVLVLVFKHLSLRRILKMRLVNKHFNDTVKQKFKRFWFIKYVNALSRAQHKGLNFSVPPQTKVHNFNHYIKILDLIIPYIPCYCRLENQKSLADKFQDEFKKFAEEANDIYSVTSGIDMSSDDFTRAYACAKILNNHYQLNCKIDSHFVFDLPLNENDHDWFMTHKKAYDINECYMSAYLCLCYKIKRDTLPCDKTRKKNGNLRLKYTSSPFYKKSIFSYKCI